MLDVCLEQVAGVVTVRELRGRAGRDLTAAIGLFKGFPVRDELDVREKVRGLAGRYGFALPSRQIRVLTGYNIFREARIARGARG